MIPRICPFDATVILFTFNTRCDFVVPSDFAYATTSTQKVLEFEGILNPPCAIPSSTILPNKLGFFTINPKIMKGVLALRQKDTR